MCIVYKWLVIALPIGCLGIASCIAPGMLTDGSSVSIGATNRGALRNGAELPFRGDGYVVPETWTKRKRNFGTKELTQLIVRSARRVNYVYQQSFLGVADLSPRGGGPTREHRSHHSGRDVDFIFYATDLRGNSVEPADMLYYNNQGLSIPPKKPSATALDDTQHVDTYQQLKLDIPRNWELIKALITDPIVPVQWIFIGNAIARHLLLYAKQKQEPAYLIERAAILMRQPRDSQNHMDHIHLRIYCAPADKWQGCLDVGPTRWFKKEMKYMDTPPHTIHPLPPNLARMYFNPIPFLRL